MSMAFPVSAWMMRMVWGRCWSLMQRTLRSTPRSWTTLTMRCPGCWSRKLALLPEGIRWVIVDGQVAVPPAGTSGALAGRVLERGMS